MSKGALLAESAIEAQKSVIGALLIDPDLVGGVLAEECRGVLADFFAGLRRDRGH